MTSCIITILLRKRSRARVCVCTYLKKQRVKYDVYGTIIGCTTTKLGTFPLSLSLSLHINLFILPTTFLFFLTFRVQRHKNVNQVNCGER